MKLEIDTDEKAQEWYDLYLQRKELEYQIAEWETRMGTLLDEMKHRGAALIHEADDSESGAGVHLVTNEKYEAIYLVVKRERGNPRISVVE